MSTDELRVVIAVDDKTAEPLARIAARFGALSAGIGRMTEPLERMNKRFEEMGAPLHQVHERLATLAEAGGLAEIGERAKEAREHVKRLGETLKEVAEPLAMIAAGASITGLAEIFKRTADYSEVIAQTSKATGLTTEQLGGLQYAGEKLGMSDMQLFRGMQYLNRNIAAAAMGQDKQVEGIFTGLLHIPNRIGAMASPMAALSAVADKVKGLVAHGNTQLASLVMDKLFGERSGMQLLPLFEKGSAYLMQQMGEAGRFGLAPTAEQAELGDRFQESYRMMDAAVKGLGFDIAYRLFPTLTPIIDKMTDWIAINRDFVAGKVAATIKGLAADIQAIPWGSIWEGMKEGAGIFSRMLPYVGGLKGLLIGIAGIKLISAINDFRRLGDSIAFAAAKSLLFPVAELIGQFAVLIPRIRHLRDVWATLDLVMDANPLGLVIAGLAALGAAAYEVYEHWRPISAFFQRLWDSLPGWFHTGVAAIGAGIADLVRLPVTIYERWSAIEGFFSGLWSSLPGWFRTGVAAIGAGIVDLVRLPVTIYERWSAIEGFFSGLWSLLPAWFRLGVGGIGDAVAALVHLPATIYQDWSVVTGFFAGVWQHVEGAFRRGAGVLHTLLAPLLAAVPTLEKVWSPIAGFFHGLWRDIVGIFEGAWKRIKAILSPFAAIGAALGGLPGLGAVATAFGTVTHIIERVTPPLGVGAPQHAPPHTEKGPPLTVTGAGSPEANALLTAIASGEAHRYNELYGGGSFADFSKFPDWAGKWVWSQKLGRFQHTSAAGLFQDERGTWARLKNLRHLADFSPASQRIGNLFLAEETYRKATGQDLLAAVRAGHLSRAGIDALHSQWTSIGSDFGAKLARAYRTQLAAPKPAQPSEARIALDFKNVPRGVEPQVETRGSPDLSMNLGYAW